jgi:hypothetical protein
MHEYQKEGLMGFAFRKSLILKGAILIVLGTDTPETVFGRKAGANSRTPRAV